MMRRFCLFVLFAILTMTKMNGQTYNALWKKAAEAEQKDLPRSQYQVLMQIVDLAQREQQWGQLMKAELEGAKVMALISPDSLKPAVERISARSSQTDNPAVQTVYQTVLRRIYNTNHELERPASFADPVLTPQLCQQLAVVKAAEFEPLTQRGADSKWFADDLLSVIGYELGDYPTLADYYARVGNRRAALITTLEALRTQRPEARSSARTGDYLTRLDSLLERYGDLPEAGEVAIERYEFMRDYTDATPRQLWDWTVTALGRWGSYKRANELRNAQARLTASQFHADVNERVALPMVAQSLPVENLRHIDQLTLRIYQVKATGEDRLIPDTKEGYKKLKPLLTALPELTVVRRYEGHADYELFKDSVQLPALPVGVYLIELEGSPDAGISRQIYYVSDVRVISESLPVQTIRYVAVNATTGQPLPGASLKLKFYNGKTETLTTDKQGEATCHYTNSSPNTVYAYTKTDRACPATNLYGYFSYYDVDERHEQTFIYTDRAIYRPGQTVHVAAIVCQTLKGYQHQAVAGKLLTFILRDANRKVVAEHQVQTDDYGTCHADFTLPASGLTGHFTIEASRYASQSFRVEEYKRPTFEVEFDKVTTDYEAGDTLRLKAKAHTYSGVPVVGARVSYKVMRRQAWWWITYARYWNGGLFGHTTADELVSEGEAVTADDGTFVADLPLTLPETDYPMFYNFVLTADVTDQGGETHQGQCSVPIGNRKVALSCDLPQQVLIEKLPALTFHLRNAAGNDVEGEVNYQVDGGRQLKARAGEALPLNNLRLKTGRHTLKAVCQGDTLELPFTVFSLDDRRPAAETDDWFYVSDTQFPRDGRPVTVQVGSSAPDVHIVYSIISGERVLESGAVDRQGELLNRKLTYKDEYGSGVLLTFAWVKQGRCYHHSAQLRRPLPDERLKLSWSTFRDRLTPGQQEEWSLVVTGPDGKPADAQLMAVLYDKSLEQLTRHQWTFSPLINLPVPSTHWACPSWGSLSLSSYHNGKILSVPSLQFTRFDDSVFPGMWAGRRILYSMSKSSGLGRALSRSKVADSSSDDMMVAEESAPMANVAFASQMAGNVYDAEEAKADDEAAAAGEQTEVQLRENLQETAFFYPRLQTDAEGRVVMTFTLPESLTTWRFMGIAHTRELMSGAIEGEAVAKKDLMIQPNVPRFVRTGDQATLSARIFNTGSSRVSGTARLQLVDPETEQVLAESAQPFALEPDATAGVHFPLQPLRSWPSLLIVRVSASGNGISDGEQHYLPVLPDRERVTLTVPFSQHGPGTKQVDLTTLFPQDDAQAADLLPRNSKLTIEYTNNPAWLMIQALPTLGQPYDDCAVSQAVSLYANSIAKHIIDQNPRVKTVFAQWQREPGDQTSLTSQLAKNQELKDLVLSETPWVADADDETEQRHRLADFFDENLMAQRLSSATEKLSKLQLGNGAWSWWPGMDGSFYMTVEISEMLVRLQQLTGQQTRQTERMLDRSFRYIGKEIVEMVQEMKRAEKKGHRQVFPSFKALQWLYMCKLDGRELPDDVQQANSYLVNLLKKDTKNQTIYEKAMSAIILDSPLYIKSLKEYTVYKEEMGRYYDTPRAGYSWRDYRIPTQVAAIEALQRQAPQDSVTVSEMCRWLLQQKRTQAWDTPLNSVNAVYAFLTGTPGALSPQQAPATLTLDGQPLATSEATAGLGYVKSSQPYQGQQVFAAVKTSQGTSWGAVYAQFMQSMADISQSGSELSVKREVLTGSSLSPLTAQSAPLKVGDRITVRITIEADRDLDFVAVSDRRAACMEPVRQLSGYQGNFLQGYYTTPRDHVTNYYFDRLRKGRHVLETEYYVDREGQYLTGTCTAECSYAPEYRATAPALTLKVENK